MVPKSPAVLIVDDDESVCNLICEHLATEGYLCDIASNGDDALNKLERYSFDVALLDIKLPGMSGIELLETVEKHYQMTAIIMISGVKDTDTAVEAMKLGALDYLIKPFTLDRLNASISGVLFKRKRHDAASNAIPSMENTNCEYSANNRSFREINAIANGVDAQVDYYDSHSKIVTERTVKLARRLGIQERDIKKWAVARDELYSKRKRQIKSTLSKLEQNPAAQMILGLTQPLRHFAQPDGEQN